MTALHPTYSPSTGLQGTASPADAVLDRVNHPARYAASGAFVTALQSIFTMGLLPLLLWPMRWAEFLDAERYDLLAVGGWWRSRVDRKRGQELDQITRRLRRRPMFVVLPWLIVAYNVFPVVMLLAQGDTPARIWQLAFHHTTAHHPEVLVQWHGSSWFPGQRPEYSRLRTEENDGVTPTIQLERNFFPIWMVSLGLAYLLHWYAVRSHAATVGALVKWTNSVAKQNDFTRIKIKATSVGLNPLWIVIAIAFCVHNVWWAVPMVFAGSLQKRYTTRLSPAVRLALAGQMREGFALLQTGDHFCATDRCGARLPEQAKFCPRCGTCV